MKFDKLDKSIVDYESAMTRFFNDEELYVQAIKLFIESPILNNLKDGYLNKDYEKIFQSAHELKGACGNLSFIALYDISNTLTETVRNGVRDFDEFEKAYDSCIEIYTQTLDLLKSEF